MNKRLGIYENHICQLGLRNEYGIDLCCKKHYYLLAVVKIRHKKNQACTTYVVLQCVYMYQQILSTSLQVDVWQPEERTELHC